MAARVSAGNKVAWGPPSTIGNDASISLRDLASSFTCGKAGVSVVMPMRSAW